MFGIRDMNEEEKKEMGICNFSGWKMCDVKAILK
jgi:hypothetical protein